MSGSMTPAQLAVLERIQKKKELQQKKASKKGKAKATPTGPVAEDASSVAESEVSEVESVASRSSRKRKLEPETSAVATPKRVVRNPTKAVDEQPQEVCETPRKRRAAERQTKPEETVETIERPDADTSMTPAQLAVLEKMKNKPPKSRKSTKKVLEEPSILPEPVEEPVEEPAPIPATPEVSVSTVRSRRRTTKADESLVEPPARSRRKAKTDEILLEISDSEGDDNNNKSQPEVVEIDVEEPKPKETASRKRAGRKTTSAEVSVLPEPDVSICDGPLNVSMQSVINKIKEKKSRKSGASNTTIAQPDTTVIESSGDSDLERSVHVARLRRAEIRAVIQRLRKNPNSINNSMLTDLEAKGVISAFDENLDLTSGQNALVVKYRSTLNEIQKNEDPEVVDVAATDEESDDEVVALTSPLKSPPRSRAPVIPEEEEPPVEQMEVQQEGPKKISLIFDTNAYINILPYCRAVLDSEAVKDSEEYEELTMFMLFMVINELDFLSKRSAANKKACLAAIKMIHGALKDKNPHIEGQDLASSKVNLAGSKLNDDFILKSADILKARGDNVIVVTDDQNLLIKISMMQIESLNSMEFIHRFHWLTPCVKNNIRREAVACGEEMFYSFSERVLLSVYLKGIMAHLAPLPMDKRREMFPTENLGAVLALTLKHRTFLISRTGPFAVISYDRVKEILNLLTDLRNTPADRRPDRLRNFARFLHRAVHLSKFIAKYFPNMESRAELIEAMFDYYKSNLPDNEYHAPDISMTNREHRVTFAGPDKPRKPLLQTPNNPRTSNQDQGPSSEHRPLPPAHQQSQHTPYPNQRVQNGRQREPRVMAVSHHAGQSQMGSLTRTVEESPIVQSPPRPKSPEVREMEASPAPRRQVSRQRSTNGSSQPTRSVSPPKSTKSIFEPPAKKPATTRSRQKPSKNESDSDRSDSIFFAFSQGTRKSVPDSGDDFRPINSHETQLSGPFQVVSPPKRPVARKSSNPYQDCLQDIGPQTFDQVYEFFQKLGMSICNYTGSCCVKLGVCFSLGFQVSGNNLQGSIHDVTEHFSLLLKSMKLLIPGPESVKPAEDFLTHSQSILSLIQKADPKLFCAVPRISPSWLCAFARDSNGKKNLSTGYQQFCDFLNCLEKCWLKIQEI